VFAEQLPSNGRLLFRLSGFMSQYNDAVSKSDNMSTTWYVCMTVSNELERKRMSPNLRYNCLEIFRKPDRQSPSRDLNSALPTYET
jgi:hypothetical protein